MYTYGWLIASLWYTLALFACGYPNVTRIISILVSSNSDDDDDGMFIYYDILFGVSCYVFLRLAKAYGEHVYAPHAPTYPGAFQQSRDGTTRRYPSGFLQYLPFAFSLTFLLPALVGLYLTVMLGQGHIFMQSLAGYLIVFSIQIIMETTHVFNRNQLTSSVPFSFGLYRFGQIARGFILTTAAVEKGTATLTGYRVTQACLVILVIFWVFDHAVTATLLPWMLNVQCMTRDDTLQGGKKK